MICPILRPERLALPYQCTWQPSSANTSAGS
ncbi:Uncharacterised protein [Vibrio cholerae]|nr:Uncharacterised protein [Vibrio cholerae]